jgi:hypothetical protein
VGEKPQGCALLYISQRTGMRRIAKHLAIHDCGENFKCDGAEL